MLRLRAAAWTPACNACVGCLVAADQSPLPVQRKQNETAHQLAAEAEIEDMVEDAARREREEVEATLNAGVEQHKAKLELRSQAGSGAYMDAEARRIEREKLHVVYKDIDVDGDGELQADEIKQVKDKPETCAAPVRARGLV